MSDTTGVRSQRVALDDGWSGHVTTQIDPNSIGRSVAPEVPSLDDWSVLLHRLLDDPTQLPGYAPIKYSDKGEVFRAHLSWGDHRLDVVCKRFVARGWRKHLPGVLQASKVRTNFDRSLGLLKSGIATAIPLAVIEHKSGRRDSWLISEFIPDLVDLDQIAMVLLPRLDSSRQHAVKGAVIDAIVDLLARMEQHELHHRDFKSTNVLLTNWNGEVQPVRPWMIDLEGLQPGRLRSENARWRPLVRLAASLLGYRTVTRTDYARFLRAYLAKQTPRNACWKNHMRDLAKMAVEYDCHAQKRKAKKYSGY